MAGKGFYKKLPDCFGDLETVFPKGEDNLRTSPDKCLKCSFKTLCLRLAMKDMGGIKVREELVDRAFDSGVIGFLERWSKKKSFAVNLKKRKMVQSKKSRKRR